MEEINWIRVFAGLLLVLFIPGYTFIQALFPRKGELDEEFDSLYRITLGMAMSICVVILVGFVLGNPALGNAPDWGNWSDGDKGFFQTFFITSSLLTISILFFIAGWYRGAYPWTAQIHPSLARAPPGIRIESELAVAGKYIPAELIELQGLKHDRDNVKRKLVDVEKRKRSGSSVMKKYYAKKENTLLADLADIDSKMADIDQVLNRPGEGEGLSADVLQEGQSEIADEEE
ncbi:uncharacterized protein METZ01_LOCUS118328 [marine metagenome]|uniref:DUF1616 domain-containing protein n=1 Tax=marine metagenome TaxID=408172 RepID=A0A381XL37_9ZZZZ|tara:strand:+ start:1664 stop:2359 length:696 start_codon:yes stop_codon:yes gene_type:complete